MLVAIPFQYLGLVPLSRRAASRSSKEGDALTLSFRNCPGFRYLSEDYRVAKA